MPVRYSCAFPRGSGHQPRGLTHEGRFPYPRDGAPATHGNGSTIRFLVQSPEQGDAFHAAGIASRGTTCEDPPGFRPGPAGHLYLAYLRDPDGNKLCALHRPPKPA